ncbi:chimeric ERCC6-PGBD3 protein [Trichonephila clavipes]|nr:chimeric ERCC6-PGBD3 protein [Trichonephila clavipes]
MERLPYCNLYRSKFGDKKFGNQKWVLLGFNRWHDNSVVTVASSGAGVNPLFHVNRYSQKRKKNIQIQQPNMIKVYKQFMKGVDRADENIDKYQKSNLWQEMVPQKIKWET